MELKVGSGPGVRILLDGDEVARAIDHWLHACGVLVRGPRTIRVGDNRCEPAEVYVDPSGYVMFDGKRYGVEDES